MRVLTGVTLVIGI